MPPQRTLPVYLPGAAAATAATPATDYAAVCARLYALKARGVSFGIDRMRAFADILGHPERAVPALHIAGTNGKGSVAALLAAILRAAGLRTGLYTSPHLVRLGERIQIDGTPLTDAEILAYVTTLDPIMAHLENQAPGEAPSFFEFMTAMAFLHFSRRGCAAAVVEVG